ncbi:MAG: leucine-rich repeat domain-containing protein, partial [Lachnospiraceae bacterium]|nr:leucine-rich repeat domain-containing protein [Lachnospiraceae bacterium]
MRLKLVRVITLLVLSIIVSAYVPVFADNSEIMTQSDIVYTDGIWKFKLITEEGHENEAAICGLVDAETPDVEIPNILEIPSSVSDSFVEKKYAVTRIDHKAFYDNNEIEEVIIPESVTSIGDEAFGICDKLEKVTMNEGLTNIEERAFVSCYKLTDFVLPDSLEVIGENAFHYCWGPKEVKIPRNVKKIEAAAFHDCRGIEKVTIEGKIDTLGNYAFADCLNVQEVDIKGSVTSIGEKAFYFCGKQKMNLKINLDGVTEIGEDAFLGSGLKEIVIPGTLENISKGAFAAFDLKKITIKNGVKSIGEEAFAGQKELEEIIIYGSIDNIAEDAFKSCNADTVVLEKTYDNLGGLRCRRLELKEGLTEIPGEVDWCSCEEVVIPSSITSIDDSTFTDADSITRFENMSEIELELPHKYDYLIWLDETCENRLDHLSKGIARRFEKRGLYQKDITIYYIITDDNEAIYVDYQCDSERGGYKLIIDEYIDATYVTGNKYKVIGIVNGAFSEFDILNRV